MKTSTPAPLPASVPKPLLRPGSGRPSRLLTATVLSPSARMRRLGGLLEGRRPLSYQPGKPGRDVLAGQRPGVT